jgi:CMP-N,N'-diacetyllegionaminic acid synthase
MNKNIQILCIIPARSGSKGIPHKNIKKFKELPLLVHSIKHAQKSKYKMRIIVSTDSKEYADIAKKYGGEVPFLRPENISQDLSTDYECIKHCIKWLKNNENYKSDIILHLRPTQPCRKVEDIDKCISLFIDNFDQYSSLRTVVPFKKSPYKMYTIDKDQLIPLFNECGSIVEPYNQCRQILPQTYLHNGYIDIYKTKCIRDGVLSGNKIYPYVMSSNEIIDIDTNEDWKNII